MILIEKGEEPKSWTEYRNTPNMNYQSSKDLVESLLKEQGYICAYCMRRIPVHDTINGGKTQEDHHVEHILCRQENKDKELDYNNMVICCPGHIGGLEDHCDRSKGNKSISFSPMRKNFIDTIIYKNDGEIQSTNSDWNKEINEILNLNSPLLKKNRREFWDGVRELINNEVREKDKDWSKPLINKYLGKYSQMYKDKNDGKSKYYSYCGIVIYFLKKKLKNMIK